MTTDAADSGDDPALKRRGAAARSGRRADRAHRTRPARTTPPAACSRGRHRLAIDVPPFDRAAMDGYAVIAPRTRSAAATLRRQGRCAASRRSTPGRCRRARVARRRVRRDRDRRADAGRRRRRRDGRGDRARDGRRSPRSSRRCIRGSTSAAAAPTSPPGSRSLVPRATPQPEPHRRARRDRRARRRRLRAAARRDPLDRQRDRRAGPAARARPDLRHQPIHARRRSSQRTAASPVPLPPAQDTLDALSAARRRRARAKTCSCFPAAARSASAI